MAPPSTRTYDPTASDLGRSHPRPARSEQQQTEVPLVDAADNQLTIVARQIHTMVNIFLARNATQLAADSDTGQITKLGGGSGGSDGVVHDGTIRSATRATALRLSPPTGATSTSAAYGEFKLYREVEEQVRELYAECSCGITPHGILG